ncbi:MAG: S8 family serine peptidase, partial [Alphaproteobacteria bacterium]|nr:S8 family serine peptidase [Alphaproteobacteria bacterium]
MTAPTSAKVGRHSLAQWMALCAAVLVLPGCGGGGGSGGSAEAPRTVNFLQAAQALSADPDEFERRKRAFEDHEYEPVIWGRTDYTGPRGLDYGHGDYGWRLLSEPTYAECQRKPEECWAPHADNSRRLINASSAYARGATGKGEVVAVYDTGISDNQSEFDAVGKNGVRTGSKVTVTKTYDDHLTDPTAVFVHNAFIRHPVFNNSQSGSFLDPYEHGTAVAAVIAARRDGREGYAGISAPVNYKSNMHGVAFDAALYVHAVGLNPLTSLGLPSNLSDWTEEHDKQSAARYFDLGPARKAGAAIVNQSFGYGIGGDGKTRRDIAGYLPEGTSPRKAVAYLRGKLKYNVAAMAQWGVPDAEKIIIVRAAGNSGAQKKLTPTSPGLISGLHAAIPELRGHVLSAVAVDQKGDLAWFSNPCGIAKDFCLAAPGVNLLVPYPESRDSKDDYGKKIPTFPAEKNLEIYTRFNGWFNDLIQENPHDRGLFSAPPDQPYYITQKYAEWVNNHLRVTGYYPASGTSLSAPLVSGGLALLRQFFRVDYADGTSSYQLGNTELVARLLKTANKTGRYADSDKYGQGLMDLDAATDPVGQLMTSLSDDPNARPFDGGGFAVSGGAFGAAMRDALGGVKIAAFDQLDAPFFFSVTDNITNASRISGSNSDTVSEHEVLLSDTVSSASLALSVENGTPLSARIRRGNLWFSYGHHGGREAGLYFGDDGGNAPENFGMNFSAENPAETSANAARHFRAPLAFASPYLSLVRDGPGLGWSQPLRSGARLGFSLMHGAPQFDHFQNP